LAQLAYLVIAGNKFGDSMQCTLSRELPRTRQDFDYPIKFRLDLHLWIVLLLLQLLPDLSREGMVILRYVLALASLLVK
jgi:hypothetical protein